MVHPIDNAEIANRIADAAVYPTRKGHCRIEAPYSPLAGTDGRRITVDILGSDDTIRDLRLTIRDLILLALDETERNARM